MINYYFFLDETSKIHNELIRQLNLKGSNFNKSMNNLNNEYPGGYSPYSDYNSRLRISREEYSDFFDGINAELDTKYKEAQSEVRNQRNIPLTWEEYSLSELLFINGHKPYDKKIVVQEIQSSDSYSLSDFLAKLHVMNLMQFGDIERDDAKDSIHRLSDMNRWNAWKVSQIHGKISIFNISAYLFAKRCHRDFYEKLINLIIDNL